MKDHSLRCSFFFFNDTATTEIYTLSLHDALPISNSCICHTSEKSPVTPIIATDPKMPSCKSCVCHTCDPLPRSEEHTSELQSQSNLVCRLLLEKKTTSSTTTDTASWPPPATKTGP